MRKMHAGDVVVDRDGAVDGMVAGDVVVRGGARVRITAMVAGDVVVEDGEAIVTGMVSGRLVGNARSTGMVGG